MAPSQRGCRVMIKRGRKGRTGRPKAPGIHINRGLVEAHPGSPWSDTLGEKDCKRLMNLLEENPCRVVQKSEAGFTVLHAAAMRGCLKLLDQVFDLFKDKDRFVDEEEGIELSLQELLKAEGKPSWRDWGKAGLTAFELAWWSMGDYNCRYYLLRGKRDESKNFLSFQSQIFSSSIDPVAADKENSSPWHLLLGVLADHRSLLLSETVPLFERFEEAMNYNFVADCEELRFHHAVVNLGWVGYYKEYVEAVIGGCLEKGPHVLEYLFQLRNAQGETPLHVAVGYDHCDQLVRLIPRGESGGENAKCLNMRDSRGWTALHHASLQTRTTHALVALLEDGRADVDATVVGWSSDDCTEATALHLAVLHNQWKALGKLLNDPRTNVNALFHRRIYFDDSLCVNRFQFELDKWTALQLAAVAGLPEMVKMLLTCPRVEDVGKHNINHNIRTGIISAIHLAAASGDPKILRLLITYHQFDPLVTCHGATSLHFVVASKRPTFHSPFENISTYNFHRLMNMKDFGDLIHYMEAKWQDAKITSYEEREACISILVQEGVDVWQEDDNDNFPDPGISASGSNQLSWQKLVASETLEAKKNLNDVGNAISVVAALVAIASYVGPLQPPLGYADDFVQTSNLSIRIFMATNSVSFYLAIASIMFAVVPSLPMPQEGIYKEWQRTRKTIGFAISLLLMSVLGVLISFTTASNAVVSEEYSWRHGGLTFYPAIVAGLVCLIGIIWFFIRLLRLVFPKNVMIRRLYQSLFPI